MAHSNVIAEVENQPLVQPSFGSSGCRPSKMRLIMQFTNVAVMVQTSDVVHFKVEGYDFVGVVDGFMSAWGRYQINVNWVNGKIPLHLVDKDGDWFDRFESFDCESIGEEVQCGYLKVDDFGDCRVYSQDATLISLNGVDL